MTSTCSACGAKNRIPARHLADAGKCGKCKAALGPQREPIEIRDAAAFDALVADAKVPVLVDFWAGWCGPCRMVAPEVKKAAAELAGRALVLKVDTDAVPALAQRYRISGIPAFRVFDHGEVVVSEAGAVPARQLVHWVDRAARGRAA